MSSHTLKVKQKLIIIIFKERGREREREREREGLSTKLFRIEEEYAEICNYAKTATTIA